MPTFKTFKGIRPTVLTAEHFVTKPVEHYSKNDIATHLQKLEYSFLHVIKPTWENSDLPIEQRLAKVRKNLIEYISESILFQDSSVYYIYQVIMPDGKSCRGLIGLVSIDDYNNNKVKKHESVIPSRVERFSDYLKNVHFHAEPVLLSYKFNQRVDLLMNVEMKKKNLLSFTTEDGVEHNLWKIDNRLNLQQIKQSIEKLDSIYIADGHHRMASSANYTEYIKNKVKNFDPNDAANYTMAFLVSDHELIIRDYNRIIKDLNGLSKEKFLKSLEPFFDVVDRGENIFYPSKKHHILMYLEGNFYGLYAKRDILTIPGLSELDTYIFEENLLKPILNIKNTANDKRIAFVRGSGDVHGVEEIKKLVDSDEYKIGFVFYPISIQDIMLIADMGLIMPPKSTYIEPKPLSGLTIFDLKD